MVALCNLLEDHSQCEADGAARVRRETTPTSPAMTKRAFAKFPGSQLLAAALWFTTTASKTITAALTTEDDATYGRNGRAGHATGYGRD